MTTVYIVIAVLGVSNLVTTLFAMKTRRELKFLESSLVSEVNKNRQYIGNQTKDCMDIQVELNRLNEIVHELKSRS